MDEEDIRDIREPEELLRKAQSGPIVPLETWSTEHIICPYCGHANSTDEVYSAQDLVCESCEKEFHVEVDWDPTYMTSTKQ